MHVDVLAIRFTADGRPSGWPATAACSCSTSRAWGRSRNDGLAVIEAGYVACHPDDDHAVVLGAQDNSTQRRIGEALWRWEQAGDGGGIAFDRVATHRYVAQYTNADWSNGPNPPGPPVHRGVPSDWEAEEQFASFYSTPATIADGATNQLVIGTDRVWYTTDWGTDWVTVPTGTDPRRGASTTSRTAFPAPAARSASCAGAPRPSCGC